MKKFLILIAILLPVVCTGGFAAGIITGLSLREWQMRRMVAYTEPAPILSQPTPDMPGAMYDLSMQAVLAKSQAGMQRLQGLMRAPAFDSPSWRRQVDDALATIDESAAEMRAIRPPANMQGVHVSVLELADEMGMFTGNVRAGVQAGSMDAMGGAVMNMQNMSRIMADIGVKLGS